MSNNNDWNQGHADANNGKGMANTNGMNSQQKESYGAGWRAQQQSNNGGGKK